MDIQQPPRGGDLQSPEMQRFLQDTYNGVKCPNFRVYMTGSQEVLGYNFGGASWSNKLNLGNVAHNVLNGWDTTNYWFKPKVPGYYFIDLKATSQIYVEHTSGNPYYIGICLSRNGGAIANMDQSAWYSNVANTSTFEIFTMRSTWVGYLNGLDDYVFGAYYNILTANTAEIAVYGSNPAQTIMQGFKLTY
jgi:hypothetical protein